jgi:ribosomal protein S12 methylthiotransferase accessory factor YcaO
MLSASHTLHSVRSPLEHLSLAPTLLQRRLGQISGGRRTNGEAENICIYGQHDKSEASEKCFCLQTCRIGAEKNVSSSRLVKSMPEKMFSASALQS